MFLSFVDELEKLAKRRKKARKRISGFHDSLRHALFGAAVGATASGMGGPFSYAGFRHKGVNPKAALIATLLRVGERSAYGIPIGMVGGWSGRRFFSDKKKKR